MRTRTLNWQWAAAAAVAVLALAGAVAVYRSLSREQRFQRLPDGAELVLTRVAYGTRSEFRHGTSWEKLLGDLIPTNGFHLAWLKLWRPSHEPVFKDDKPQLVAEFKLRISPFKAANHPLVSRTAGRQLRGVVSGADGVDYATWLWPNELKDYRDGYFGYVLSSCFPRNSKWLQLRIEQSDAFREPWHTVASFTVRNPTRSARLPWVPRLPSIVTTNRMDFAPQSDFAPENLFTLPVPKRLPAPLQPHLLGVPVTISWVNQMMLAVDIPTNATHLRVLFVRARDEEGRDLDRTTGSWGQHGFWRALNLSEPGDVIEATIAIVPNVHATYLTRPTLVRSSEATR